MRCSHSPNFSRAIIVNSVWNVASLAIGDM